jgi:hypothetical protein
LEILAYVAPFSLQLTVFNLPPQEAPPGKTTRMSLQQYASQKVRPMLRKLRLSRQQMIGPAAFMRRTSRQRLSLFSIPSLGIQPVAGLRAPGPMCRGGNGGRGAEGHLFGDVQKCCLYVQLGA